MHDEQFDIHESMFGATLTFDPKCMTGEGIHCSEFYQNIFQHVVTSKPPLS